MLTYYITTKKTVKWKIKWIENELFHLSRLEIKNMCPDFGRTTSNTDEPESPVTHNTIVQNEVMSYVTLLPIHYLPIRTAPGSRICKPQNRMS
jgi:hypothetical protein